MRHGILILLLFILISFINLLGLSSHENLIRMHQIFPSRARHRDSSGNYRKSQQSQPESINRTIGEDREEDGRIMLRQFPGRRRSTRTNQQFFVEKPKDSQVVGTKDVTLNCRIGNLSGQVQWSKDGFLLGYMAGIPGHPRYSMVIDADRGIFDFRIRNVSLEDEGDFQCQVSPGSRYNQPIRAGAKLTVIIPPAKLTLTPLSTSSFRLIHKSSLRYSRGGGHQRPSNPQFRTTPQDTSDISNKVIEVQEGENILLTCKTPSMTKPATEITWTRDAIPISENVRDKVQEDEELHTYSTESTVELTVRLEDQGSKFKCRAHHVGLRQGSDVSDEISLSVHVPPPAGIIGYDLERDFVLVPTARPAITGYDPERDILHTGERLPVRIPLASANAINSSSSLLLHLLCISFWLCS